MDGTDYLFHPFFITPHHFEEFFVFLEQLKTRNQIIAYLLSESALKTQELEALLKNIFSPILKQEVMMQGTGFIAVAAREAAREATLEATRQAEERRKEDKIAAEQAKLAALQLNTRTLMMRSWKKGASIDFIADIVALKKEEVEQLFAAFERGKAYFEAQTRISSKKMMKITDLTEEEVLVFINLLKGKK